MTTLKFNWGKGIMLLYFCFVAGIVFMVYKSSMQKVDLVTNDYYKQELAFENQIQSSKNATAENNFQFSANDANLILSFTKNQLTDLKGSIHFYKPDNENLDMTIPIQTNSSGEMIISKKYLKPGLWKMEINWQSNGKSFYSMQPFNIQ